MSKMILALVAFISTNVLLYLAFAFIAWELDPSQWSNGGRAVLAALGMFLGILSAIAATGDHT
jgi:hypothetical protein